MDRAAVDLPLGRKSEFPKGYAPSVLRAVPRAHARSKIADFAQWHMSGHDSWLLYEVSWLEARTGRPCFGRAILRYSAATDSIVESKSLKLYLGGFHCERTTPESMRRAVVQDVSLVVGGQVQLDVIPHRTAGLTYAIHGLRQGRAKELDELDQTEVVERSEPERTMLGEAKGVRLRRNRFRFSAFRSLCPVTAQPDFASVWIETDGVAVDPEGLLRYLSAYRDHQDFHEACVERIASDLWAAFPELRSLHVSADFERRGGIAIYPVRTLRR